MVFNKLNCKSYNTNRTGIQTMNNTNNWLRDEIKNIEDVPHGSTHLKDILDFSSSVIRLDIPIKEIILDLDIYAYPDSSNYQLRESIAKSYNISSDSVFCGNGSSEILWYIGLAFVKSSSKSLLITPTFGEYKRVLTMMGSEIEYNHLMEENDFSLDLANYMNQLRSKDIAIICNPNNPTGELLPFETLESIFKSNPSALYIIDCAYLDFVLDSSDYRVEMKRLIESYNIIFLHSLTKGFGIAGLRSGYCIGSEKLISYLNKVKAPWNMNRHAQAVSEYIITHQKELIKKARSIKNSSFKLRDSFSDLGYKTIKSTTDYFMVKTYNSLDVKSKLLEKKMLIRELDSMGLKDYIRVTGKSESKNQHLIKIFKETIYKG